MWSAMNPGHSLHHLILVWTLVQNPASSQYTTVSVTESLENNNVDAKIARDASSFVDLVSYSNIFVDKSLLIKEVLENSQQTILITYPRKWGKSVNLDMIKTFVEIEYNSARNETVADEESLSYKVFVKKQIPPYEENEGWRNLRHPLLITQHQHVLDKHRGQHPVIYVNMAHPKLTNYDNIILGIRESLVETFASHKYLMDGFRRRLNEHRNNQTYVDILEDEMAFYHDMMFHEQINEIEMENSLKFLTKMLYEYYNKRVFVLIDHYDIIMDEVLFVVHNSSMKEENDKAFKFFEQLYHKTFTGKDYIEKIIMTGILGIDEYFSPIPKNELTEYNTLNQNTLKFFGFTRSEVERLFHHFIIPPQFSDKIFKEQSGYKMAMNMDLFYNPQKIVHFLSNQTSLGLTPNFQTKIGDIEFHSEYEIEEEKLRSIFGWLSDVTIQFEHLRFSKSDLECIQNLIFESNKKSEKVNPENVKLVLLYLYATGCVTFSDKVIVKSTDKSAKILVRLSS